jgi:hypothetical protein
VGESRSTGVLYNRELVITAKKDPESAFLAKVLVSVHVHESAICMHFF